MPFSKLNTWLNTKNKNILIKKNFIIEKNFIHAFPKCTKIDLNSSPIFFLNINFIFIEVWWNDIKIKINCKKINKFIVNLNIGMYLNEY